MKTVTIRKTVIGEGMPKICVPLAGIDEETILEEARSLTRLPADVAEWRLDWFEGVFVFARVENVLRDIRSILGDMPVLLTLRTANEGGEVSVSDEEYADIIIRAAETGLIDLADVEVLRMGKNAEKLIAAVQSAGVRVIASNHVFDRTPDREDLISRLRTMQDSGADILKIAVMPESRKDVLTLLEASEEMTSEYAECPIVAISMGGKGVVSRVAAGVFGSAMTFGAADRATAPGQIGAAELKRALDILYGAVNEIP